MNQTILRTGCDKSWDIHHSKGERKSGSVSGGKSLNRTDSDSQSENLSTSRSLSGSKSKVPGGVASYFSCLSKSRKSV